MLALVTGSGRCGTNSVAAWLDGQALPGGRRVTAAHESAWPEIVAALLARREDVVEAALRGFAHDVEVSPYLALARRRPLPEVPLIGIVRDGRKSVRSGMTNGWYYNSKPNPGSWVRLQPRFPGDRFDRCCRFWAWTYRRLERWGATIFRLEELVADPAARGRLLDLLGLAPSDIPFPVRNQTEPDAEVDGPAHFPPYARWTAGQRDAFARHCGRLMDRWYPGWREG
ncbi:MAG TPA: hypothetical protein VJT67_13165 [Longimicrobiaceae bacterium]|nr:hypothetical protein [Longimicrobiaceae bacterium]